MNAVTVAGIKLSPWPSSMADELKETKVHIALASIMFAYTLTKVEIMLAEELPNGSPAVAIVHGDKNIIAFSEEGWNTFCTTTKQRAFVLVHELYHIFFQHHARAIDMRYHPLIANYAYDYYNNLRISGVFINSYGNRTEDERYKKHFEMPIGGGLYDEKYLGMTADEIYNSLVQDMEDNKDNPDAQPIDMTGYNGSGDLGENESYSDLVGDGGSEEKQRENTQTLAGAAVAAKNSMDASQLSGTMEGDMVRLVEGLMKPTICWKDRFENAIRSSIKIRETYNKWNTRSTSTGNGIIFPSYTGEKVSVVFGIDSSGSMSETCTRECLSELYGLIESLDGWSVDIVCCDTELHEIGKFSNEDGDDFDDIPLTVRGLGGTYLSPIIDYAEKVAYDSQEDLSAIIICTDGFFCTNELDSAIKGDIPVIVVVVRNGKKDFTMANATVIHIN